MSTLGTRAARPPSTRQVVAAAVTAVLVLLLLELASLLVLQQQRDRSQLVSRARLQVALETFRPLAEPGLTRDVATDELAPSGLVRTRPRRCAPLALLTVEPPLDAASWTGTSGWPARPVTLVTVRYPDAGAARWALRQKRLALLRCRHLALTFPPFEQPPEDHAVSARFTPTNLLGSTVDYALVGPEQRFDFVVSRYGNTLTWAYGDPEGAAVRRQVVMDLTDRLAALARE